MGPWHRCSPVIGEDGLLQIGRPHTKGWLTVQTELLCLLARLLPSAIGELVSSFSPNDFDLSLFFFFLTQVSGSGVVTVYLGNL